ncbi:MAG: CBS domain-containing protein [Calditrichaeota bacterium]|nr:MAG: CBS domain-containing protein [Calditrichota bacterium]
MKLRDILQRKGNEVVTISQDRPLHDAVRLMVENNIGAVLVRNETDAIVGILSERDILREAHQDCQRLKTVLVKDVMTLDLIVGQPDDDVTYAEQVMIRNRIRHLPIFEEGMLVGMISMRDIVQAQLSDIRVENRYLYDYITGKYPG